MAAVVMSACGESGLEERASVSDNAGAEALLQVRTRGGDETTVSYPVQVFVFAGNTSGSSSGGSGGDGSGCLAVQTIGDAGQALNIALTEGTYSVYAVGGAGSADYVLPAKSEATTTTALMLKDGKALTDLMAASATATLTDGGTNTVTLGMQRKTMLVEEVTIRQVPSAATAVSVTIAPLWQSLTVGGTYSGTAGSQTISLTKQSDGRTWKAGGGASAGDSGDNSSDGGGSAGDGDGGSAGGVFLLPPSSEPASVGVSITLGGATKTYTYSTTDELSAGYRISIDGTYTEAIGVNLTGTITGAAWLGQRTISFTFDESGSVAVNGGGGNDNAGGNNGNGGGGNDDGGGNGDAGEGGGTGGGNDNNTGGNSNDNQDNLDNAIPVVGDTWNGGYVLAVGDADGEGNVDVTILSSDERVGWYNENATTMATNIASVLTDVGGDSGIDWHVPSRDEAKLMYAARAALGLTGTYLTVACSGEYRALDPTAGSAATAITGDPTASTKLRPVAVITLGGD